ncbi:MAG: DUF1343 domain-containing protein [Taibaiella sp.]|nr:DUF1343 domain-containing protein [Taibaiella sp.]
MPCILRKIIFLIIAFVSFSPVYSQEISINNHTDIISGAGQLNVYLPLIKNKRVALLINQSAVIGNMLLVDTLLSLHINVVKIFVPEHGLRGREDAGATIGNSIDSATGLPVVSLYGKNKKPSVQQLADVDIVIYDLQDVGVRFYTYISTLQYAMEACAENNKTFVLLDRPNPNGFYIDGPVLDTSLRSFVGMQPIPVVYGMTAGEYAKMLVGEHWFAHADSLKMQVVSCVNYDHTKKYELLFPPSPNLRTMAAVYIYPSLCFFEGTIVDVGRGTDKPFQQWGHPNFYGKSAYSYIPESTVGASQPLHYHQVVWGQCVAYNKKEALSAITDGINLSWLLRAYKWAIPADKERFFTPFFDKLAGNTILKLQVVKGMSEREIKASWQADIAAFKTIRKKYLLYKDFE